MPWAGRLWAVAYVSHKSGTGVGTGPYEIDDEFNLIRRPESHAGTYTNRFVHYPSNQLIIGPWVIDADRDVRAVESLLEGRTCGIMPHPDEPDNRVHVPGMEDEFFELDVHTLQTRRLLDQTEPMQVSRPRHVRFKAGYGVLGKVVAANRYDEKDFLGKTDDLWQSGKPAGRRTGCRPERAKLADLRPGPIRTPPGPPRHAGAAASTPTPASGHCGGPTGPATPAGG